MNKILDIIDARHNLLTDIINGINQRIDKAANIIRNAGIGSDTLSSPMGKTVPVIYSRIIGPFNYNNIGSDTPIVADKNIVTDRNRFILRSIHATKLVCIQNIGVIGNSGVGKLFSPINTPLTGGATNVPDTQYLRNGFELTLYNKKTNRFIYSSEGNRIPYELLGGGRLGRKKIEDLVIEPNSDIEIGLYPINALITSQSPVASAEYINLVFSGIMVKQYE